MKTVIKPDIRYFDESVQRVIESHSQAQMRVEIHKAISAEREACAKVCENEWSNVAERMYGEDCAKVIRARGQA